MRLGRQISCDSVERVQSARTRCQGDERRHLGPWICRLEQSLQGKARKHESTSSGTEQVCRRPTSGKWKRGSRRSVSGAVNGWHETWINEYRFEQADAASSSDRHFIIETWRERSARCRRDDRLQRELSSAREAASRARTDLVSVLETSSIAMMESRR